MRPGPGSLRLLLALLVVASHMSRIECGRIAVMIFFYLSGYWVTRNWDAPGNTRRVLPFLAGRLARIFPLYWLVLAAEVTIHPQPANFLIFGLARGGPDPLGVSWSLDIELQFYLLVPLLAYRRARHLLLPVAIVLAAVSWSIPQPGGARTILHYLPVFLLGALTHARAWRPRRDMALASLAVFAAIGVVLSLWPATHPLFDKTLADPIDRDVFAMLWMLPLLPFLAWLLTVPSSRADRSIGEASYALYLVHYPLIRLLAPAADDAKALVALAAVGLAFLLWWLVDRPLCIWRRTLPEPFARAEIRPEMAIDGNR